MQNRTWLEVALNGAWGRAKQPGIPVRVDEIVDQGVACVHEGAAIIHVHAYDEATGRQRDDADLYARIIEGIRARVDCIVYPTLPFSGDGPPEPRFAAIEALAARGLIEWASVDPGSVNLAEFADVARGRDGFVYRNPESHVRHGLALAARHGFHPGYAIYEPGFLRLGAALTRAANGVPQPVYRFMFSDGIAFGFPPEPYALDAYLRLLEDAARGAPWMVAGLAVDVLPLVAHAVARGGHVRTGLEDAPLNTPRGNVEWTRKARAAIERAGGRLASAADVRQALQRG
jgi:uncharacterized protein (DUF849 family)